MALIPPQFLNSLVSIGVEGKNEKGEPQFSSIATGFLIGKEATKNEKGESLYRVFIVTNRHVFQEKRTGQYLNEVLFRFNTTENKSHIFKTKLLKDDNTPLWSKHENEKVDLAVLPIAINIINNLKIEYHVFTENEVFMAKDFASKSISTGDGLFVLGFPMSISGKAKNFVIVRQGIIARVDDEVLDDCFYYIDSSAYPGNSGGPVIIKPELVSISGTGSNNTGALVGVISSGETYSDVAISKQTGEPRIVFTEQTGLVRVVPTEFIYEIIEKIMKPTTPEAKIEEASSEVKG